MRVTRKPDVFDAVQVIDAMLEGKDKLPVGLNFEGTNPKVGRIHWILTRQGPAHPNAGDWIVTAADGTKTVVTDKEFTAHYQQEP